MCARGSVGSVPVLVTLNATISRHMAAHPGAHTHCAWLTAWSANVLWLGPQGMIGATTELLVDPGHQLLAGHVEHRSP